MIPEAVEKIVFGISKMSVRFVVEVYTEKAARVRD